MDMDVRHIPLVEHDPRDAELTLQAMHDHAVRQVGAFWAVLCEPSPLSVRS